MNRSAPLVSILMPVYNAAPYVKEAIESILTQTFTNFELLVFNDGSTDNSSEVIRAIDDKRITLFDYKENSGYVAHLNEGLRIARGQYIARMDADDIAFPDRLAKQVALLANEPAIGLCGTGYQMFGTLDRVIQLPSDDKQIREFMLEHSPMGHPTVMFSKTVIAQHNLAYDKAFMPAEDYKMWYDFSRVSQLKNLPDILLHYRVHPHQISSYQNATQRANADAVRIMQLTDKGFRLSTEEQKLYCRILSHHTRLDSAAEFEAVLQVMQKVLSENTRLKAYGEEVFQKIFAASWHRLICAIEKFHPAYIVPVLLKKKPIAQHLGLLGKIKFVVKSVLFWKIAPAA